MKRSCQHTRAGSCPSPGADTEAVHVCELQDPGLSATILYDYSCKESTERQGDYLQELHYSHAYIPALNYTLISTCDKLQINVLAYKKKGFW